MKQYRELVQRKGDPPLPSNLNSEVLPLTQAQKARVCELEAKGWVVVTPPELVFGGSMMIEGPDRTYIIDMNGDVK